MRRDREAGSATVFVLACVLVLIAVGAAVSVRGLAVLARHRAESAADLAALAGAGRIGTAAPPCPAARSVAQRNGARVLRCTVALAADGRSGTVSVAVSYPVDLPLVGSSRVSATARAGRLPAGIGGRPGR